MPEIEHGSRYRAAVVAPSIKHRFRGSLGHDLVGRLELPDGTPRAAAVLGHCFTCGKDLKSLVRLARELAARGVASLRFDVTGVGESAGEFAATSFSSIAGDTVAAADFLRELGHPPALLVGHSLGGTAMLAAAPRVPDCRLVATIASPGDTARFRATLLKLAPEALTAGEDEIVLGGRRFTIRRHLLDDLAEHRLHEAIAQLGRALIVFQSPVDETLDPAEGLRLFDRAAAPKSFVALPGASHLMLEDEATTRYIADVLAAWVARYL